MKNLTFLALLGLVLFLSVQVSATEKTCSDNPLLPALKQFIAAQNEFVDKEEDIEYLTEDYSDEPTEEFDLSEFSDGEFDGEWDGEFDGEWDGEFDGEWDGESHELFSEEDFFRFDGELWERDGEFWRMQDGEGLMWFRDGEWLEWDGEGWVDFDGEFHPDWTNLEESEQRSEKKPKKKLPKKTKASRPKNPTPKNEKQKARLEKKEQQRRKKKEIKKQLQQEILKQKFSLEDITAIENATPAVVNGLPMCKSLNGQASCCTQAHILKFKKLTKGYFLKKIKEEPKASEIYDLLEEYSWQLSTDECEIEDLIYEIEENEAVQAAYEKQRACQKKAVLITNNLIRGTICQVCMNPANYDTIFAGEGDNLQMKIHPDDMQQYREEMTAQMQCAEEAFQEYRAAAKSVVENIMETQSCAADLVEEILEIADLGDLEAVVEAPTCSTDPGFFSDGCLAEFEAAELEEIEAAAEVAEAALGRRILASGGYLEDPAGVSGAYETNPEEEAELNQLPDATETPQEEVTPEPQPEPAPSTPVDTLLSGSVIGTSLMVILGLVFLQF